MCSSCLITDRHIIYAAERPSEMFDNRTGNRATHTTLHRHQLQAYYLTPSQVRGDIFWLYGEFLQICAVSRVERQWHHPLSPIHLAAHTQLSSLCEHDSMASILHVYYVWLYVCSSGQPHQTQKPKWLSSTEHQSYRPTYTQTHTYLPMSNQKFRLAITTLLFRKVLTVEGFCFWV